MLKNHTQTTTGINLLPWRATRRRRSRRHFFAGCLLSLLLGTSVVAMWMWLEQNELRHQQGHLHFLTTELARLDNRLKVVPTLRLDVAALQRSLTELGLLSASRSQTLRMLLLLATNWVQDVRCLSMYRINDALTLTGSTAGNAPVVKLMSRLEATGAFATIKVNHINGHVREENESSSANTEGIYSFEALLKLHPAITQPTTDA